MAESKIKNEGRKSSQPENHGGALNTTMLSDEERSEKNRETIESVQETAKGCAEQVKKLRSKLSISYWVVMLLSVTMFVLGVILLAMPIKTALSGGEFQLESLVAPGFGIADLVTLFLFNPVKRIHNLMGDMSQIILAINSFQIQRDLRLVEMDVRKRESVGKAAEYIGGVAENTLKMIQQYFEEKEE